MIRTSIAIATHNKPTYLRRVLESIVLQTPPFEYEIIVVDDGPVNDDTQQVCSEFPVHYERRFRSPIYQNPAPARNMAYRFAQGDVVICQSDDVMHGGADTIERLTDDLLEGEFHIATVHNINPDGLQCSLPLPIFTGPTVQRPLFFLGSLWRKDLYAVGGNDEEFTSPAYDDDWFADCLMRGLKLQPRYVSAIGKHIDHRRPENLPMLVEPSRELYNRKVLAASQGLTPWCSSGGPWEYPGPSSLTQWWNECHAAQSHQWLAGYNAADVFSILGISPQSQKVILDIGVGTGGMARELTARDCTVDCLDISDVALNNVKPHSRRQYLVGEPLPLREYDLAICHLVAQHVSDSCLMSELQQVIAALKSDGMLAIQFADSPARSQSFAAQRFGGVCRSRIEAKTLIESAGGVVLRESDTITFTGTSTTWYVFLVGRLP